VTPQVFVVCRWVDSTCPESENGQTSGDTKPCTTNGNLSLWGKNEMDEDNEIKLTKAEERLEDDRVLGALDFPDPGPAANLYFRQGFELFRTVDQPDKVRSVLESYLRYGCDEKLRAEIEGFLNGSAAQGKEEIRGQ
jgi:hypothetical protein